MILTRAYHCCLLARNTAVNTSSSVAALSQHALGPTARHIVHVDMFITTATILSHSIGNCTGGVMSNNSIVV